MTEKVEDEKREAESVQIMQDLMFIGNLRTLHFILNAEDAIGGFGHNQRAM